MSKDTTRGGKKRKRYTDDFRASAVLMLEAAGYPDSDVSLAAVARKLKIPESTLRSWYNAHTRSEKQPSASEPPANIYAQQKKDLKDMIKDEIDAIFTSLPDNRMDASYRDKGWVLAVLIDKLQLLDNKPTAIIKLQEAIETGKITKEEAAERWPALMKRYDTSISA